MSNFSRVCISRSSQDDMVYVHERGSTRCYVRAQWEEYCAMIRDFNLTGVSEIKNYEDLPTRTPLHANTPKPKVSIDDLI